MIDNEVIKAAIENATLIEVKPDDVLVLETEMNISPDQAARIKEIMAKYTDRTVLVLGSGMHLRVLRETA